MLNFELISCSILGSSIAYFFLIVYPSSKKKAPSFPERIENWSRILTMDWRLVLFDIIFSCCIISFAYTIIILGVVSARQALLGGLTAEAFFYHYINNARFGNNKEN